MPQTIADRQEKSMSEKKGRFSARETNFVAEKRRGDGDMRTSTYLSRPAGRNGQRQMTTILGLHWRWNAQNNRENVRGYLLTRVRNKHGLFR
jgi:hypothetical protein